MHLKISSAKGWPFCSRGVQEATDSRLQGDWKSLPHRYPVQRGHLIHCNDVIMGAMASQITSLTIVYSTVYSGGDQRKHQISASLAFVWGIHRWPVNSPHKWPVTRKMFPFDDVIMIDDFPNLPFHPIKMVITKCAFDTPCCCGMCKY